MGKKGSPTNAIDFASWITAERRWVMSGTPTPQTISNSGVGNLYGLLKFLNHAYFCTPQWGEIRYRALDRELKDGHLASFFNLRHLLNLFMVRHTKDDVQQLFKPVSTITQTDMTTSEKVAYNTLVSAVQMNLVATSMKGKTSGKQVRQYFLSNAMLKHIRSPNSNFIGLFAEFQTRKARETSSWKHKASLQWWYKCCSFPDNQELDRDY